MCGDGRPCQMGCDEPRYMPTWLFVTLLVVLLTAWTAGLAVLAQVK